MRQIQRVLTVALAALAFSGSLAQAGSRELALQPGSKLWLTGSSTVSAYKSQASKLEVTFQHDPARWAAEAKGAEAVDRLIRAGGVTSMNVVVAVKGLHSPKEGLDKNMYKALKAEQYPEIRFRMTGYQVGEGTVPAESKLDAKGVLTVAGVDQEIRMAVTALREGDAVRLRASTPLLMSQFGIKPPKMMLGTLRTADKIVVHFDLLVGAKDGPVAITKAD